MVWVKGLSVKLLVKMFVATVLFDFVYAIEGEMK